MQNPYRYAWLRILKWLRRSLSYLWLILLAGYLLAAVGQSMYRTYQAQEDTHQLEQRLAQSQLEKQRLEAVLVYLQTDTFKEKELRRALLMIKPGEKVYALPEESKTYSLLDPGTGTVAVKEAIAPEKEKPSWRLWLEYVLRP